jgi:hypothetical protein
MRNLRNVTVTLDEKTARWARVEAARRDTSVSKLIGEMLRERMARDTSYETAMARYLGKRPENLRKPGQPYPRRDELYERDDLR